MFPGVINGMNVQDHVDGFKQDLKDGKSMDEVYKDMMFAGHGPSRLEEITPKGKKKFVWDFVRIDIFNVDKKADREKVSKIYTDIMTSKTIETEWYTILFHEASRKIKKTFFGLFSSEQNVLIMKWGKYKIVQESLLKIDQYKNEEKPNG